MTDAPVAIVDYGLGNLFSVRQACLHVGLAARITAEPKEILAAPAVILPGVGAFGDAMNTLRRLDLVAVIKDYVASSRPLLGICLGMQLLMTESDEFGRHEGLDIVQGRVCRFPERTAGRRLKVPLIGWTGIYRSGGAVPDPWQGGPLQGTAEGELMYFVHSYTVQPIDPSVVLATSRYGDTSFCSALQTRNVWACQFHPERSGPVGLSVYTNLAALITGIPRGAASEARL